MIDTTAKAYWDTVNTAIAKQINDNVWTTARLRQFVGKLPVSIPTTAYVCTASLTPAERLVLEPLWTEYVWCARAINFMLNGTRYDSRESMDLRCASCRRFTGCPKVTGTDKVKYCVATLKLIADDWVANRG